MCIERNIVTRSRNHFTVETEQIMLHVTVKFIQIFIVAQQCFYCKLMSSAPIGIIRTGF